MNNGSLVIGNMLNAAHAIGLGACWIHRAKEVFESERGKALLDEWGISEDLKVLVMLHSDMQLWSQNLQSLAKWAMCASLNNI